MDLIEVLKALSHENRIRILNLLKKQELCVCELENIMQVTQSNASRHLAKLKQVNIINAEQKAQWVYYSINKDTLMEHPFLEKLIEDEFDKLKICMSDAERLKQYQDSELSCDELPESTLFD